MDKKIYEIPQMEVLRFETEDVIVTSTGGGTSGNQDVDLPDIPVLF